MRIGALIASRTAPSRVAATADALAGRGLDSVWTNHHPGGWDPVTLLAGAGGSGPAELGTAVAATYPTHPAALAASVRTAADLTGGRLVLGLGPSHEWLVTGRLGIPYTSPAAHTREYLEVLRPLLRGEHVRHTGRFFTVDTGWDTDLDPSTATAAPPSVLLAATGPRMLEVARDLADGIVVTWARPALVEDWLLPRIAPGSRVAVVVQVAVTDEPDVVRAAVARDFAAATRMPAYRAVFDRGGLDGPGDSLVAGTAAQVGAELRRFADAGVTDLLVTPVGPDPEHVLDVAVASGA